MLVELTSAGLVQAHSGEGLNVLPRFALEDELQGNGIEDNYAVSSKVQVWIPGRGDIVYAIIEDATNIAIGDFLESNGAGFLQLHAADAETASNLQVYPLQIVAQAVEAVAAAAASSLNSSESPIGLARRIKVRIV